MKTLNEENKIVENSKSSFLETLKIFMKTIDEPASQAIFSENQAQSQKLSNLEKRIDRIEKVITKYS